MEILIQLQLIWEQLTPSEKEVAVIILNDPAACSMMTITELAMKAKTSKATISRLSKHLNLKSYRELRLILARESSGMPNKHDYWVTKLDDSKTIINKVRDREISIIRATLEQLDNKILEKIAETLSQARQVTLMSSGGAYVAAFDAYYKLLRLGITCFLIQDQREQKLRCSLSQPGDVFWIFSISGSSKSLIEVLKLVKTTGVTIISLTNNSASPIAKKSNLSIFGVTSLLAEFTGTMEYRLSQLCIVDSIFLFMIKAGLTSADQSLKVTEEVIINDCLPIGGNKKNKN